MYTVSLKIQIINNYFIYIRGICVGIIKELSSLCIVYLFKHYIIKRVDNILCIKYQLKFIYLTSELINYNLIYTCDYYMRNLRFIHFYTL